MSEESFWDSRWLAGFEPGDHEKEKISALLKMVPDGLDGILDVGCGPGWMMEALGGRCQQIVGIAFSTAALAEFTLPKAAASGINLPFKDNSFDLILCTEVLEHYLHDELDLAVAELCRVSRNYILVSTPFNENRNLNKARCALCLTEFHSSLHMRSFDEKKLSNLFQLHGLGVNIACKTGRSPYRSALLGQLNSMLTGYYHVYYEGMQCPVCGNVKFDRPRARVNPVSLVLEGMNWMLGKCLPSRSHNVVVLFEKRRD